MTEVKQISVWASSEIKWGGTGGGGGSVWTPTSDT